jgi:phosphate transport system permease protein
VCSLWVVVSRPRVSHVRAGIFWTLCGIALVLIIAPAIDIIVSILAHALPVLKPSLITESTAGTQLGLQNAILGTLTLSLGVLIVAGTIGVLAGMYLAEFAPPRFAAGARFFSEVLAGVPSIVVGYVGYLVLVNKSGLGWHYSLLAGVLALSALILPYIVKTTELAFSSVPRALREGAIALGMSRGKTIRKVLLPPALPGIVSGLVLALAISTGETAPLLFTAGFSDQNPSGLFQPVGYLTNVTYTDITLPGAATQSVAYAAAGVTVLLVLLLIFAGRRVTLRSRRMIARMDV